MRVAVMASGRGSNFDALLQSTRGESSRARIALLICDRGGAPVLGRARRAGVPTVLLDPGTRRGPWAPEGVELLRRVLREHRVEVICLAGFMRILPPEIVREYRWRILNIHPALLPAFPGLHAQRQALRAGVKVSGCTVHFVDEGMDSGPILLQRAVPVRPEDDEESLAARILEEEHRLYPEALRLLAEGRVRVEGRRARVEDPAGRGQR